ncbi:hypothetical protein HO409_11600 [Streptococcus suis]|nr:hypothetical protein [Streptococcus suis]
MIPKFRVWDTVKKAMSEVEVIVYTEERVYPFYSKVIRRYIPFSEAILMQSTGLFDKKGNDIWEGDVVEFEDADADDIENVYINQGVIEWRQGGFTVSNRTTVTLDDLLDGDKLEVTIIGNIHQHPELLEVE